MPRTLESAKEVVAKAIEYGVWNWKDPDAVSDADVMDKAEEIVDVVQKASQSGIVSDAVMEILFAAQVEPTTEPAREAYTKRFSAAPAAANGQPATTPQSSAPSGTQDASSSEQASPVTAGTPTAGDIDSIFPGYDELKVADIKKAVLASAASGELSPDEWKRIKAYEAAHEERRTILSLQPEFRAAEPEPVPESHSAGPSATGAFAHEGSYTSTGSWADVQYHGDAGSPPASDDDVAAYYDGRTTSRAAQEGLPIPPSVSSDSPPVLPIDITTVSDQELSRTATIFHSYFARTQWLLSQEEGRERAAEALEQDAHRDAFSNALARHESAIPDDKRTGTAVENARRLAAADADGAQAVSTWRNRKIRHGIDARELKALASGYDKAVWRVNEELDRRARLATTGRATQ
jgi:hypothetical protein